MNFSIFGSEGSYAHAFGIISGKQSKLFDFRVFESLINAKSVSEVIASLEGTEYDLDMREVISAKINIKSLENALNKNFLRNCNEIFSVLPKGDAEALSFIVFEELNLRKLISIIRRLHSNLKETRDERHFFIPYIKAEIDYDKIFSEISDETQERVEKFISKIYGTKYYFALRNKIEDYKKLGNTMPLECELIKKFIKDAETIAKKKGSQGLREFLSIKIDIINLKTLLRGKLNAIPYEDFLLPNGLYLKEKELRLLLKSDVENFSKILEFSPYSISVNEAILAYKRERSLLNLEISLDKLMYHIIKEKAMLTPLSIYSILSFIAEKEREIKNLQLIFHFKECGLTAQDIRETISMLQ